MASKDVSEQLDKFLPFTRNDMFLMKSTLDNINNEAKYTPSIEALRIASDFLDLDKHIDINCRIIDISKYTVTEINIPIHYANTTTKIFTTIEKELGCSIFTITNLDTNMELYPYQEIPDYFFRG